MRVRVCVRVCVCARMNEDTVFPVEILGRIAHWLYQAGDDVTVARLLSTHTRSHLHGLCERVDKPVVFVTTCVKYYELQVADCDKLLVDWGDDVYEEYKKQNTISHSYACGGNYRIRVYTRTGRMRNLRNISSFSSVGNLTDLSYLFRDSDINIPLRFNTSRVTKMGFMFWRATSFNQPLHFDTSNVTDMHGMFCYAITFNQLLHFDTSRVTDMNLMFYGARAFNQALNFDTSRVTNMSSMFWGSGGSIVA